LCAQLPPVCGSSARLQLKVRWRNVGEVHPPSPVFPSGAVSLLHLGSTETSNGSCPRSRPRAR
jgi:hypothetical protein